MRSMWWVVAATGVLAGCAGPTSVVRNPGGYEQLTETCQAWSDTCQAVHVTGSSKDEEAWFFEGRFKVRSLVGIPYGRHPSDQFVVGDRARCEEIRNRFTSTGTPTEACQGPVYFHRD